MFKTKNGKTINATPINGQMLSEIIHNLNPELANQIKKYLFDKDNILGVVADYLFGEKIICNNNAFLSLADGSSISFNDPSLPEVLRDHLSFTPSVDNPVGMILNHESEFFRPKKERIVSYGIIKPGQIFGYAHIIDKVMHTKPDESREVSVSNWNLNAGATLAFLLPPVSENQKHAKMLKRYGITVEKPNEYIEQCRVFQALNAHVDSPWKQSVLYFSKHFLDKLVSNKQYKNIHETLHGIHRSGYNIWHSSYPSWESDLNDILSDLKLNGYSAYAANIAKHIYLIGAGGAPGFIPALDDSMLPKNLIEEAYTKNGYGLNEHWPIIMQPKLFDARDHLPVYYGIKLPTLINYNPETFSGKTTIALLFNVYTILSRCQDYILNQLSNRDTLLYKTANKIQFSFYHSEPKPEEYGNAIKSSELLPKEDHRFHRDGWNFPYLGSFVRGCIKIEPRISKDRITI